MKTICILFLVILVHGATAQHPASANQEEMKKLNAWVGKWKGEGSIQMGPGEPKKSTVEEQIESRLEGLLLVVEGVGKSVDPATQKESVVHHAFGVLSYDAMAKEYRFKTYLRDGRGTDAYFKAVAENKFEWGFDIPSGGKTRYVIVLDPIKRTWNEIGEFSRDGNTWMKFFEMNLVKQ